LPDAFVACFSIKGSLKWLTKLNLDSIPSEAPIAFSATLSAQGKNIGLTRSIVYDNFSGYGLFMDRSDKIVYNGIVNRVFSSTPLLVNAKFANETIIASPELLKKETDVLVADQTDRGIAGLFAAILLVKNMGVTLSGKETKAALDKYNPAFKKNNPNIYKNLEMINFVNNNNGIITILTEKGSDVLFDKIKVENKSTISIYALRSGDLQFDILSGIKVGKILVWYNLNFIRLSKINGDMMFDYDIDHSQKKINMRRDILN